MKRCRLSGLFLSLVLTLSAVPLAAHTGVFVPQPRVVGAGLDYRVVILASNQGDQPRRFEVSRVTPQPLGPPQRERLHGQVVPRHATRTFVLTGLDAFPGILEVTGAPQITVSARLEIREQGILLDTVALPAVAASAQHAGSRTDGSAVVLPHGGTIEEHLQGLASEPDGSVTSDLTIVNFDDHEEGECAFLAVDADGEALLALPFLHVPPGAAAITPDLFAPSPFGGPDESPAASLTNAQVVVACETRTFTAFAAVYRDGGRDVEYIRPAASLK